MTIKIFNEKYKRHVLFALSEKTTIEFGWNFQFVTLKQKRILLPEKEQKEDIVKHRIGYFFKEEEVKHYYHTSGDFGNKKTIGIQHKDGYFCNFGTSNTMELFVNDEVFEKNETKELKNILINYPDGTYKTILYAPGNQVYICNNAGDTIDKY